MRLRQIRVKEKPEQLVQLFVDTFYAAGLWVPLGDQQPRLSQLTMLTAYDPRRRVSFTVMFQPNPDGTTTLILGESHLATKERLQAQTPVPVYPGAEDPVTVHQEGADLLTYRVLATEPELLGFYAKALGEAGYSAGPEPQPGLFVRGREQVEVRSELQGKKRRVVVTIRSGAPGRAGRRPRERRGRKVGLRRAFAARACQSPLLYAFSLAHSGRTLSHHRLVRWCSTKKGRKSWQVESTRSS